MTAKQPFFVSGLPRSRTAWMANWLTTDHSLCLHDEPFRVNKVALSRMTGFSGSEICTQYEEIEKSFPGAPWVIILRKPADAFESFMSASGLDRTAEAVTRYWDARLHLLAQLCRKPNVEAIPFDDLDSEQTARKAWSHLMQGEPFNLERWLLLWKLTVTQNVNKSTKLWLAQ